MGYADYEYRVGLDPGDSLSMTYDPGHLPGSTGNQIVFYIVVPVGASVVCHSSPVDDAEAFVEHFPYEPDGGWPTGDDALPLDKDTPPQIAEEKQAVKVTIPFIDDVPSITIFILPEAQEGGKVYFSQDIITPLQLNEKFSEDDYDEIWKDEGVNTAGNGSESFSVGDLDILWGDVPYAFKRRFPFDATFGGVDSFGEDGYIENLSIYVGAMGEIDQEMAEQFPEGDSREGVYVPDVVYFGIHVQGRTSSQSIYVILAHTTLADGFVSGDVLSGPTKNVKMILAPAEVSLLSLGSYNDFLGGGAASVYMVGPSGIGEDGDFDPIVFSETPVVVGDLYIADTRNSRIVESAKANLGYIGQDGSAGSGDNEFNWLKGIAVDDTYIYIADSYNNRIVKRFRSDLSFIGALGSKGSRDNEFDEPSGIAVDDTYVYVADTWTDRIVKRLKSDFSYVSQIGTYGSGNDEFYRPSEISVDDTHLYIADCSNNRIVKRLKSDLSYVSQIGCNKPKGLTVDNTYVYIADTDNNQIVKRLKTDLSYVDQVGSSGSGDDQFNKPRGVAVDDTHIYVADTDNSRIVKRLKTDLSYVSQTGSNGSGNNEFNKPEGIACISPITF